MSKNPDSSELKIAAVSAVTPHNKALWEVGKTLLIESIQTGREFCQFMISTCFSAIPIYLGLLKVFVPDSHEFSLAETLLILVPVCLFLAAAVIFILGYMPVKSTFSLDMPGEIERAHTAIVEARVRLIRLGVGVFLASIILAVIIVLLVG